MGKLQAAPKDRRDEFLSEVSEYRKLRQAGEYWAPYYPNTSKVVRALAELLVADPKTSAEDFDVLYSVEPV